MITTSLNSFAKTEQFFSSERRSVHQDLPQFAGVAPEKPVLTSRPQGIVDKQLFNALEKTLNKDNLSLRGLDQADFTPEKVADRIVSVVSQALGQFINQHPQDNEADFIAQVRTGIEKGFNEARDILQSLNVLQGKVAEDIDTTYALVQDGLDRLELKQSETISSMQYQELSAAMEQATEIQIKTQDGDVVNITLSQSLASSQTELQVQQGSARSNGFEYAAAMRSSLNVNIEGNLDKGEKQAIDDLLQNMHKVANNFFKGDIQTAFNYAQKIGFNADQIAGFSLDLKMNQSIKAVSAYQQTSTVGQAANTGMIKQAADFMEQARGMLDGLNEALAGFEKPDAVFKELFSGAAQMSADKGITSGQNKDLELLTGIVQKLLESINDGGIDVRRVA
jgi:uncharacterized protein DUF5610